MVASNSNDVKKGLTSLFLDKVLAAKVDAMNGLDNMSAVVIYMR